MKTGKSIEHTGYVHDHVSQQFVLGYKILVAGYWDKASFIPIDFSIHREKRDSQINKAQKQIEKFLGQRLDYDEGGEHTFYLVLKDEDVIGVIRPHAERGKHGIVEMVWAFTLDGRIKDFKIQRSRERGTALIKAEGFRGQFRGRTLKTAFTEKKSRKINTALFTPPKNAEKVSSLIAYSAKKNLFLYKLFFPEYNQQIVDASKAKDKKDSEKENIGKDEKK